LFGFDSRRIAFEKNSRRYIFLVTEKSRFRRRRVQARGVRKSTSQQKDTRSSHILCVLATSNMKSFLLTFFFALLCALSFPNSNHPCFAVGAGLQGSHRLTASSPDGALTKCGLFGRNIICHNFCGFFGRLLFGSKNC
jgi:hypothetical protein